MSKEIGSVEASGNQLDLPLDIHGTAFQRRVWQALCEIPAGPTVAYSEIAKRIGMPRATRAVAAACAANKIAVLIPCHRVVRKDGKLGGYRWGIERKRALLARRPSNEQFGSNQHQRAERPRRRSRSEYIVLETMGRSGLR